MFILTVHVHTYKTVDLIVYLFYTVTVEQIVYLFSLAMLATAAKCLTTQGKKLYPLISSAVPWDIGSGGVRLLLWTLCKAEDSGPMRRRHCEALWGEKRENLVEKIFPDATFLYLCKDCYSVINIQARFLLLICSSSELLQSKLMGMKKFRRQSVVLPIHLLIQGEVLS